MPILVPQRPLVLSPGVSSFTTPRVPLSPQAESVTVRIARPTTAAPVTFAESTRLRVTLFVRNDDVTEFASWEITGGIRVADRLGGGEAAEWVGTWNLPMGFFGIDEPDPTKWAAIKTKRWGERAATSFEAWATVEKIDGGPGAVVTTVEISGVTSPAPDIPYHHSIAFDTSASAQENNGDGIISVSFTATAGTNRVAVVSYGGDRVTTAPTSFAITYGGAAPSIAGGWDGASTFNRNTGKIFKDSEIGTGAKTITATPTGGTGSWMASSVAVMSFTGVDQTTPWGTAQSAGADTGTAPSVTVTGVNGSDVVVGSWHGFNDSNAAFGVGVDETAPVNANAGNPVGFSNGWHCHQMSYQAGTAGGVMSCSKGATWEYAGGGAALKAAVVIVTSDVTSTAAVSRTEVADVTSTAAVSRTVTSDVTSTAAVSRTEVANVTTDASIISPTYNVTTDAAISATATSNVATDAAISTTGSADVSSNAAVARTAAADVTSDAATTVVVSANVTSDAAISTTATADVSSTAAASRTEVADITSNAATSVVVSANVTTDAAISTTVTASVTSDAATSVTVALDVPTTAAIAAPLLFDVASSASISVPVRLSLGPGSVSPPDPFRPGSAAGNRPLGPGSVTGPILRVGNAR